MVAALMDTPDMESATIARLTVTGSGAGMSDMSVGIEELADEQGRSYQVVGTEGISMQVVEATGNGENTPTSGATGGEDGSSAEAAPEQAEDGERVSSEAASGTGEQFRLGQFMPVMALAGIVVLVGAIAIGVIGSRYR